MFETKEACCVSMYSSRDWSERQRQLMLQSFRQNQDKAEEQQVSEHENSSSSIWK